MISEGRLSGFVDQIESVLHFQGEKRLKRKSVYSFCFVFFCCSASEQLAQWDRRIESFCVQVNQILDKIQTVHPDWCAKSLAMIETKINVANASTDDEEIKAMEVS